MPYANLQASRGVEGCSHQDGGAWGRMEAEVVPNNTCGHRILQTKPFLLNNLEASSGGGLRR